MFHIGDKIVCSHYGVGIIENIEDKDILGEVQKYFTIKPVSDDMTVFIPLEKIEFFNLRPLSNTSALKTALDLLAEEPSVTPSKINFKERYSNNSKKIASASLKECSEVIRDLSLIKKTKSLNSSERTQLISARQLVSDEISLIKNISRKQADDLIDAFLA